MKIQCPGCKEVVPGDQVNMGTDLAFCPQCNNGFKISETVDQEIINEEVLRDPPKGTWYRKERNGVVLGASTRSAAAFFLVPFMLVWSGGSLGGIYGSQILSGKFDLLTSLFGIPFLLGSILLWALALMAIWGRVVVTIGRESSVFVGIGPVGWSRSFNWSNVKTIREDISFSGRNNSRQTAIVMEGDKRLRFGSGLNEARRYFLLSSLKYLKSQEKSLY